MRPTLERVLNQSVPFSSRVMPWLPAAKPLTSSSRNFFTAPVLASILAIERPVAAVVRGRIRTILLGEIVFPEHGARGLARRTRAKLDLHRAFAGATRARQIGRQFLLVKFDVRCTLVIGPEVIAEHVDVLHQIQDRVPASLIELVLQRIARAMAAGAVLAYLGLHPKIFRRV